MVLETTGTGKIKGRYLRGLELLCQSIGVQRFYYLFNERGDVTQRVSDAGDPTPVYDYTAYGNPKNAQANDPVVLARDEILGSCEENFCVTGRRIEPYYLYGD